MNPLKTRSRKDAATGTSKKVYVIDFFYPDAAGVRRRFRRDARVQLRASAEAEAKRLYLGAITTGVVPGFEETSPSVQVVVYTFADAVKDWKSCWVKKHSTKEGYEINFDTHLVPRFGSRPLDSISFADVSQLRAALKERAVATVNNVEVALRSVLRVAVDHSKLAAMPKLPPLRRVPKKLITPPTIDEVMLVLEAAYPAAKLALTIAAFAGLRSGEVRALRFRDIDLTAGIICVRSAISRGVEGPPKSGYEREIPISGALRGALEEAARRPHKPDHFVSLTSRGTRWAESSLLHALHSVLRRVDLPKKRLHDLRHFFVTECFQAGIAAPDVQKLAGHLHLQVTQGYAHTTKKSQREAMGLFDAHLAGGAKPNGNGVETDGTPDDSSPKSPAPKAKNSSSEAA